MQVIKHLEERIHEEIHDAKEYTKFAIEVKHEYPAVAHTAYTIATQELEHQSMLHEQVVKLIEQHRREHGAPPAAMLAVYDFLHKQAIEKIADVKRLMEIYKET